MDSRAREALSFWSPYGKRGLDNDVIPARGHANWIWLPTASCLRAMLRFAGFDVDECIEHRFVTTVVARAVPVETRWGPNLTRAEEDLAGARPEVR